MKLKIILIAGKKQSGKDTVSKYLSEKYNYLQLSFAQELKRQATHYVSDIFRDSKNKLFSLDFEDEEFKKQVIPYKYNTKKRTYRELLQYFGTEFVREFFDDSIWAKIVVDKIKKFDYWDKFVISDFRFKNEFNTLRDSLSNDYKIVTMRVDRFNADTKDIHISENDLNDFDFDYILENNDTLESLYNTVEYILVKEGI